MSTLDEMVTRRKQLEDEICALDDTIREHTDLPLGWEIDPGVGLMAGGVTLHGHCCEFAHESESVSISVSGGSQYGSVFFIKDVERGNCSPWIDPEAVRAALRIYDLKEQERHHRSR